MERDPERPGWAYYAAIVLFVAVLGFAVLGLVRSSSRAAAATGRPSTSSSRTTPSPPGIPLATGPVPTPQIPPPSPSAPTQPPSRTYLYPSSELATTAPPEPGAQPRR
ncbi:MAG TPA: hypothetical protein VGS98_11755 [Thermoanaerobaculia bacterium]|nr:hypothetical protein [Thermoanaerobaculia bacterium]